MSEHTKIGAQVHYTTVGRYPKKLNGVVVGHEGGWVKVKATDGEIRKARAGSLHAGHHPDFD